LKTSINSKGFISAKWPDCFVTMKDIRAAGNALRLRYNLRPMSMAVLYRLRSNLAEGWLDDKIKRFRRQPEKWRGNPYLAYRQVGPGYCYRPKNADAILTAMFGYRLCKPRGLPSLTRKRRKALV